MDLCTVKYFEFANQKPTIVFSFNNKSKQHFLIEQGMFTEVLKKTINSYKEAEPNGENLFFTSLFLKTLSLTEQCLNSAADKLTLVKHQVALVAVNVLSKREFLLNPSEVSNLFALESCLAEFPRSESQLINSYFRSIERSLMGFFKEIPDSISREIIKDILTSLQDLAELCGPNISKHVIEHLKFEKFENIRSRRGDICSICLKNFETGDQVSNLSCSHLFHFDCIKSWFSRQGRCAICRNNSFVDILKSLKGSEEDVFGKNLFLIFEKETEHFDIEVFFAQ